MEYITQNISVDLFHASGLFVDGTDRILQQGLHTTHISLLMWIPSKTINETICSGFV